VSPADVQERGTLVGERAASPAPVRPRALGRFWLLLGGVTAFLGLAMGLTLALPTLGFPLWHYNVAFGVSLLAAALGWPLLRQRRAASYTMLLTGTVATVTGFVMLYSKDFPYKEWITWWHSVTSFLFLLAFLAHWLLNHARLKDFTTRLLTRERAVGIPAATAWVVLFGLGVWTALPDVRAQFTRDNYLYLASWAIFAGVTFTYGLWLLYRVPAMRARLQAPAHRTKARSLVDTGLWLANWGALLTGFALLYFSDFLRAGTFKYVSKWWHTATSVLFLGLVALHIGFNAKLLKAHARRIEDDLR